MNRFEVGDRVRADLPDVDDPDHDQYHGRQGEVVQIFEDSADVFSGDERDRILYRIEFENGEISDFRWRDLRPP